MGRGKVVDVTLRLIDQVTAPLNTVGGRLAQTANQWLKAGKQITRVGNNIASVGGTMTKSLTMPIVGLGTAAVKVAADFEAGMSNVKAICGTVSKDDLGSLEKAAKSMGIQFEKEKNRTTTAMNILQEKAKEMGAKTKFSATEAAEAYSYMAMAGWKAEDMLNGIEPIMKLAGATGEELATTSDIVTDALTAFGMTSKDTQEMVDVLAATANNANTNVSMLGESFTYVAPVAGSMGYSIQDVSLALGLMANAGIKASNSGTALRSTISRMAAPTKQVREAMDALGLTITNSDGTMRDFKSVMMDMRGAFGPTKISSDELTKGLAELEEAFAAGEMTESEFDSAQKKLMESAYGTSGALKAQYAAAIAGKTGMSGLLAIVNASDSDWNKLAKSINKAEGAANRMYKTAQNNLKGQLTVLKSTIESIGISFGQKLTPYVKDATEYIQSMADKFNSLTDEQQNTIIKIGAIVAAAGPAIFIFGKIVASIGGVVTMIGKVGMAFRNFGSLAGILASPAGIVIGVLAALAIGAVVVYKNWDKLKPIFTKVATQVKGMTQKIMPSLQSLIATFKEVAIKVGGALSELFNQVAPVVESVLKTIADNMPKIQSIISTAFNAALPHIQMAIDFLKEVAVVVGDALIVVIQAVGPIVQKLGECFKEVFPVILDIVKKVIEQVSVVLKKLEPVFKVVFTVAAEWVKFLVKTFSDFFDSAAKILGGLIDYITGIFTGNWKKAWEGVKSVFSGIMGGLETIVKAPLNGVISMINGVIKGVNSIKLPGAKGVNIPLIPQLAKGTQNWKGGIVQISEKGGEIVDLPQGSRVYPHDESVRKAYADGANSKGNGSNINISFPNFGQNIVVRNDNDIKKLADQVVKMISEELEETSDNTGGEDIGYVY